MLDLKNSLLKLLCSHNFALCHFDRKNLCQQILEWRNPIVYRCNTNDKISPLRSCLAPVEMTLKRNRHSLLKRGSRNANLTLKSTSNAMRFFKLLRFQIKGLNIDGAIRL